MQSNYTYLASNVQAQKLDEKVLYYNDFEHIAIGTSFTHGNLNHIPEVDDSRGNLEVYAHAGAEEVKRLLKLLMLVV